MSSPSPTKQTTDFPNLDLVGRKFERLEVVERHHFKRKSDGGTLWYWLCKCDCGNTKFVATPKLTSGELRSCGCLQKEWARKKQIQLTQEKIYPFDRAQLVGIVGAIKSSAKGRGLAFDIPSETILELSQSPCYYCNTPPSNRIKWRYKGRPTIYYNGLDRVNNEKGYTLNNVVPCCKICNIAKNNQTQGDFLAWVERVHAKCNKTQ